MKRISRRGFTLIELLIVIAIIAVLFALVMPAIKMAWKGKPGAIPTLKGTVNDEADVLTPEQEMLLQAALLDQERQTSNQIVVLTVHKLADNETVETYAEKVFTAWKLGQKGKDNGILIVVAVEDHKMRIEVGRGLEGTLTDAISKRIILEGMQPNFRQNDFAGGINNAVHSIGAAIKGEFQAQGGNVNFPNAVPLVAVPGAPMPGWMILLIILIVVVIFIGVIILAKNGAFDDIGSGLSTFSSSDDSSSSSSSDSGGYSGGGGSTGGGGASGSW